LRMQYLSWLVSVRRQIRGIGRHYIISWNILLPIQASKCNTARRGVGSIRVWMGSAMPIGARAILRLVYGRLATYTAIMELPCIGLDSAMIGGRSCRKRSRCRRPRRNTIQHQRRRRQQSAPIRFSSRWDSSRQDTRQSTRTRRASSGVTTSSMAEKDSETAGHIDFSELESEALRA
jgi:hypothetical protein